jgi:hypothetical protein
MPERSVWQRRGPAIKILENGGADFFHMQRMVGVSVIVVGEVG